MDSCQPEEALRWCERAQQLYPNNVQVLEVMGPLLLDMGHTDRAIDISSTRVMRVGGCPGVASLWSEYWHLKPHMYLLQCVE